MPMLGSDENSTQIVPMEGGLASALGAAGVVYFSSICDVGRAEKFIFLRLVR